VQINQVERELRALMRRLAPTLLALPGCGVLSAATLFAETAGARRFRMAVVLDGPLGLRASNWLFRKWSAAEGVTRPGARVVSLR
jgi:hypothetical protein